MTLLKLLIIYILVVNVITFVTYGVDKYKAKKSQWRIPEAALLWMAVWGGSIGALLAMRCFRHKTQHWKFALGLPLILVLQLILIFVCLFYPNLINT